MLNQIKKREKEEKEYLLKLQKQRTKASKDKKAYWTGRINDFFLKGIMK